MPRLLERISPALMIALATALVSSGPALAQENERWYQVELIIFSNEDTTTREQWEATPTLAYPTAARFLVYPQQLEARLEGHDGTSEVDEYGRQFLYLPKEELPSGDESTDIPPQNGSVAQAPGTTAAQETAIAETPEATAARPTPFIALPHSNREFHGKSAYMHRSGYYRTLFHETWAQPVRKEDGALPLIIDNSGDTGDWPRLQGSIKLHISRYLHIETNLWLNTRGEYLPGEWRMPAPPMGPPSLIIEEPEPELDPQEPYFIEPETVGYESELPLEENMIELEDTGPIYPWRHAVLLQQKRRMRSNELHYIDHPLLGVVVKLTPLDEEQLAEMARAEESAQGG